MRNVVHAILATAMLALAASGPIAAAEAKVLVEAYRLGDTYAYTAKLLGCEISNGVDRPEALRAQGVEAPTPTGPWTKSGAPYSPSGGERAIRYASSKLSSRSPAAL